MQNANVEAQNIYIFNLCLRFSIFWLLRICCFRFMSLTVQTRSGLKRRDWWAWCTAVIFTYKYTLKGTISKLKLIKGHILYKVRFPAIQKLWKCPIVIPLRNTHNTNCAYKLAVGTSETLWCHSYTLSNPSMAVDAKTPFVFRPVRADQPEQSGLFNGSALKGQAPKQCSDRTICFLNI